MQQSSRLLSTIPRSLASSSTAPQVLLARATLPKTPIRTAATSAAKTVPTSSTKPSYSRYTPAAAPAAAAASAVAPPKARTTKKSTRTESTVAPTNAAAPTTAEPVIDATFPLPQLAAAIPDYAALAPPLEPSVASTSPPHSIHLVEAPGFDDPAESVQAGNDWSKSFHGLSSKPFDKEVAQILMRPLNIKDIEIKPDGLLYLPEIKYRRTLNEAFGPGGWGMAPRGETTIGQRIISREWGLVCLGRLVSVARGEQEYFSIDGIPTAIEACKSNAVLRCCKDLGIASELWDPTFIKDFKKKYCTEAMVEHVTQKKKRKLWRKKEDKFEYPYKEL